MSARVPAIMLVLFVLAASQPALILHKMFGRFRAGEMPVRITGVNHEYI